MQTRRRAITSGTRLASFALRALTLVGAALLSVRAEAAAPFGFEQVVALAELQARTPYRDTTRLAPADLQALTYDQYRDIRFRPDQALWRPQRPFALLFFHLGGPWPIDPARSDAV